MKALVIEEFGGPEVFHVADVPDPKLRPGHVLIRVAGSSVNPIDWKVRSGAFTGIAPDFPAVRHRLFAEHLTAEYRGRTVEEWKFPAHRPDNHWLDCVVGCAAAASMQGVERIGAAVQPTGDRPRLRLSGLQRQRVRGRGQ